GKIMPGRSLVSGEQPAIFKYTGKELDDENALEWYYFGARYYDAEIGRFWVVDPLAKTNIISPNLYCNNSPIILIDSTGMDEVYYDEEGNETDRNKRSGHIIDCQCF
ncbi:MAG: hypothetical protein GF353_18775, partial [Candidatus Lokiarchaeota archaeon]|nr:hypothetical protein [Candidatus Lokiarchaeota archaeon]